MDILTKVIKLFFGSKSDKDRKEIMPYVEKIKALYPSISALTNDELRARSQALSQSIADFIAEDEKHIADQKLKLELPETSLKDKERISKDIDDRTKHIDDTIEQNLEESLPEAFAI
ncbi:MAG: preprotein translocase subunit SecA, partial [Alistipes sp.]|nr:preprotein translocase subunit SecA [Alistipes sp.]